jgi:hypothetical protein
LFAANNVTNQIEVYDSNFKPKAPFARDKTVPHGFSVFGVRDINSVVFVSYAGSSDTSGGIVDMCTEGGVLIKQLINNGENGQVAPALGVRCCTS